MLFQGGAHRQHVVFRIALGKVVHHLQEHFYVLHLAHLALVIVHGFHQLLGMTTQGRTGNLYHIAEFFEGDAQAMNGCGVAWIELLIGLLGAFEGLVHGGDESLSEPSRREASLERLVQPLDALAQFGQERAGQLALGLAQQFFLLSFQALEQGFGLGKLLQQFGAIRQLDLDVT